ncbi:MAG: transcriptional regulator [gamma proteobacterium symbiont of Lucinoma myriamae]|nr:transcriptional regulator [gamma proteobacterium symbiont of Lucinoma myriamae]MCU7819527.1 transcriptional regulator [gamma proteobacterium symbiont of Lucinoma myriamae]
MYKEIFFTNILRLLEEKDIQKNELSDISGVSPSFVSDLTNGKGNPSLKTMEAIALALDEPLPTLLEETDLDKGVLDTLSNGKARSSLPKGFVRMSVVLKEQRAFVVKKWDKEAHDKIRKLSGSTKK